MAKAESKRAKAEKKVRERLPDVPRVADEGPPNLEAGRAARCVRAAAPRRDKGEEGRGQERKAAAKAESKRAKVEKKVRERRCKAGV